MQLRDARIGIDFPSHWGFFGGSIDRGELPEHAAKRELFEELGCKSENMNWLNTDRIDDLGGLVSHSFYLPLTTRPEKIELKEGMDLGLFSLEEVMARKLYSIKIRKLFPVVPHPYIAGTITKLMENLRSTKGSRLRV